MKYMRALRCKMALVSLVTGPYLFAQEICNNGIDDDADGLIDLNDTTECDGCTGELGNIILEPGITNGDFETTTCIPQTFSEMSCAPGWFQSTDATSDLFHVDGFWPGAIPEPVPSGGSAIAGGFIITDWFGAGANYMEYFGTCLDEPLLAGMSYTLRFNVAGVNTTTSIDVPSPIDFGSVDLTLYGSPLCSTTPLGTYECPTSMGTLWQILGAISYQATGDWSEVTISFTPTEDINSIQLGGPCAPPADFIGDFGDVNYFFYDDLVLIREGQLEAEVLTSGGLCTDDLVLEVAGNAMFTGFQWFQDGIAIASGTGPTLDISAADLGPGTYSVHASLDTSCALTSITVEPPVYPEPIITVFEGFITCQEIGEYQWFFNGDEIFLAVNNFHLPLYNGFYTVSVTNAEGCTALSDPFLVSDVSISQETVGRIVLLQTSAGDLVVQGGSSNFSVSILDMSGRVLFSTRNARANTGLFGASLPQGLYAVLINDHPLHWLKVN